MPTIAATIMKQKALMTTIWRVRSLAAMPPPYGCAATLSALLTGAGNRRYAPCGGCLSSSMRSSR
ncbi:hypothetical protein GCM10017594_24920 [Microbacterium terrae]|nr:hypothetical protein GCM10017594_24920 [Microbacterium terrae]